MRVRLVITLPPWILLICFASKKPTITSDKAMFAFRTFFMGEDDMSEEDYVKEVITKHPRPGNVTNLHVPQTNNKVYEGYGKDPT